MMEDTVGEERVVGEHGDGRAGPNPPSGDRRVSSGGR